MNLEKAILIATNAHQGQFDKAGAPYILHPLRVMFDCKTESEKICGILHDVIEDTTITIEKLKAEGFKEEILEALEALTKRKDENYDDFINRVLQNKLACHVKLADLSDNMDLTRITEPAEDYYKRLEKYRIAADKILNTLDVIKDNAYDNAKEIGINGCVSVRKGCSQDEFLDKFNNFIERNHWHFDGEIKSL